MPLRLALMLALVVAAAGLTVALGSAFAGHRTEGIGTVLGLGLVVALVARLVLFRRGGGK